MTAPSTAGSPLVLAGVCRSTWPARWRRADPRPLRHAVEVHRSPEELDDEPELALCGAVVAVTGLHWTELDPDRCPECHRLAGEQPGR
jgi:hypothetical protein